MTGRRRFISFRVAAPLAAPWAFVPLILILAIWFAARAYYGIIHDARLYTVQAFYVLQPDRYDCANLR